MVCCTPVHCATDSCTLDMCNCHMHVQKCAAIPSTILSLPPQLFRYCLAPLPTVLWGHWCASRSHRGTVELAAIRCLIPVTIPS